MGSLNLHKKHNVTNKLETHFNQKAIVAFLAHDIYIFYFRNDVKIIE